MFPKDLKLVVFDVDGTLYQQSKLRKIMFFKIVSYYLPRPWLYKELLTIFYFRKERERKAGYSTVNLQEDQYLWAAEKLGMKIDEVKRVIDKWIFSIPNAFLKSCMYPGVSEFIEKLRSSGIKTATYSDYDSREKLKSMQIGVDLEISSTDQIVNSFKPLPAGLLVILSKMKIDKKNSLYIGDRFELDGLCAKNAGVPFLLVDKNTAPKNFFLKLSAKLSSQNKN
ncbi:HAD family hydrolase [Pedobacter heparinus]|uniref:phosphoglycolate phosphatase n=2 Tax=Pedobacter heparinus TaxID=984 RepID=C6XWA4_PEDHD|nr:HAD family hydrolase [Pedobacter heparinus]ACU04183.1 Haloacid dehalogenase domain protein hydrolase [Pedobacter heparinus DSM 2366]